MGYKWNPFTCQLDNIATSAISAKTLIIEKNADESISAMKAVYMNSDTTCKLADSSSENTGYVLGVAINAGNTGSKIKILVFGILSDQLFSFGINEMIFLGSDGQITSTPPSSGVLTRVGFGLGNGSIMITIEKPQIL